MSDWSRRHVLAGMAGTAALGITGWPGWARTADRPALPIPPELKADDQGEITFAARRGTTEFMPGIKTRTAGFSADYLGPAIRVRRGDKPVLVARNQMDQPITFHWHGLIIPGELDGGPYNIIQHGEQWRVELPIDQPAATLWFHPHIYPNTAELVIDGLAGLIVIDDDEADALPLPKRWGIDDIPVIIQDRRFTPDGQFHFAFNIMAVGMGYVGDTPLVNGAIQPIARTAKGWLRLRILDGSNARNYRLAISDGRPFHVIGSDGGLLAEPVTLTELPIAAGERYEILIDARDGKAFDLITRPVLHQPIMRLPPFDEPVTLMTVQPHGADGTGSLPDSLVSLPAIPEQLPPVSQGLVMQMYRDKETMKVLMETGFMKMAMAGKSDPAVIEKVVGHIVNDPPLPLKDQLTSNAVNGKSFSMIDSGFTVPSGTDMVWAISEETDKMLHPVHVHGCQFRIVALDGKPPPAHMRGWKDIAPIENGGHAEIYLRFPHKAPGAAPYMAHCHILEHEDSGMMTQFSVS